MIAVVIKSNLDLDPREEWPLALGAVTSVWDYIVSGTVWETPVGKRQLSLKVVRITWKKHPVNNMWYPHIELNIGPQWENMSHFVNWYKDIRYPGRVHWKG